MTNQEIFDALAGYNFRMCNETFEDCPISITSREDIEGEEAELIRFTFGKNAETCVAVVYDDGTMFTPYDWQGHEWDECDWAIEYTRWNDMRPVEAVVLNGMPRIFA